MNYENYTNVKSVQKRPYEETQSVWDVIIKHFKLERKIPLLQRRSNTTLPAAE